MPKRAKFSPEAQRRQQEIIGHRRDAKRTAKEFREAILDERTRRLVQREAEDVAQAPWDREGVVLCHAGGERFGLRLREVRAIVPDEHVVSCPSTVSDLSGIYAASDGLYNVIDLASLVGLKSTAADNAKLVLLHFPNGRVAFRVDDVEQVDDFRYTEGNFELGLPLEASGAIRYADGQEGGGETVAFLTLGPLLEPLFAKSLSGAR
ncbi:hypothetical protein FHS85_002138 [Rhodoligotrophos appendicifer]|uniref:chemotaxis protein CheW n=1 Tax=Rhodoligotrophos appendicifer TaxID=987056 RepID=UPI001184B706|nr:chemotaxis protein CheW [Rhodoligotrophos appendicifer]